MSDDYLYIGEIRSTEHNLPMGQRALVNLRGTKLAWIDEDGRIYDRQTGEMIGNASPPYTLRVATIQKRPRDEMLKPPSAADIEAPPIQALADPAPKVQTVRPRPRPQTRKGKR